MLSPSFSLWLGEPLYGEGDFLTFPIGSLIWIHTDVSDSCSVWKQVCWFLVLCWVCVSYTELGSVLSKDSCSVWKQIVIDTHLRGYVGPREVWEGRELNGRVLATGQEAVRELLCS